MMPPDGRLRRKRKVKRPVVFPSSWERTISTVNALGRAYHLAVEVQTLKEDPKEGSFLLNKFFLF